jgi:hypothetical protein
MPRKFSADIVRQFELQADAPIVQQQQQPQAPRPRRQFTAEEVQQLATEEPIQEQPGLLQQAGEGALEVMDIAGAPTRAAAGQLFAGEPLAKAGQAFVEQVGEPRAEAPTGEELAEQLGVTEEPLFKRPVKPTDVDVLNVAARTLGGPVIGLIEALTPEEKKEFLRTLTRREAAGLGLEVVLDPLTFVPGGVIAKGIKPLAKGIKALAKPAAKVVTKPFAKAAKVTSKTLGDAGVKVAQAATGVPEHEVRVLATKFDDVMKSIKRHGEDLPAAADNLRSNLLANVNKTRQSLNSKISTALEKASTKANVDITAVSKKLEDLKGRLNPTFDEDAIAQIDELILKVNKVAPKGKANVKDIFDLKQFLQKNGYTHSRKGVIFDPSPAAAKASRQAAAEAVRILNPLSPDIKRANNVLSRLHRMEGTINKSLITPGKPEAQLLSAGARTNLRSAAALRRLGRLTGTKPLEKAEILSTARRFRAPGLTAIEATGKDIGRFFRGGAPAAAITLAVSQDPTMAVIVGTLVGSMTSPMALREAIRAGRYPLKLAKRLGADDALTTKSLKAVIRNVKSADGQKLLLETARSPRLFDQLERKQKRRQRIITPGKL